MKYRSTAEQFGETIDCRCLTLAFELYQLSGDTVLELCEEAVRWLAGLVEEGFVCKQQNTLGRSTTAEKTLIELQEKIRSGLGWSYDLEAFAVSPVVHNIKTMNEYNRKRFADISETGRYGASVDFPEYWERLFSEEIVEDVQIEQNMIRLFREENRKSITDFNLPDVQALIWICPYARNRKAYWGTFSIDFSAFCLNRYLSGMAERFAEWAKHISEQYVNVNARIHLQPLKLAGTSPYMSYFGRDGRVDQSHITENCTEKEWYTTYYLPGVEWLNIISPLARKHIPAVSGKMEFPQGVSAEELNGGGLLIGSTKNIEQYQIADAIVLKKLLYPVLYPGSRYMHLSKLFHPQRKPSWITFPRSNWEIVPVFEEEIKVVSTYLVFSAITDQK